MALLEIKNLHASIGGKEILKGIDLQINQGEIHAVMGPNGAGKSTLSAVLAGRPDYKVTEGTINFMGKNLLEMTPEERSWAGIFLSFQYPIEIPGVSITNFMKAAINARRKAQGLEDMKPAEFLKLMKEKMAFVKAGIIKPRIPVVIGELLPETLPVFESRASECQSGLTIAWDSEDFSGLTPDTLDLNGDYQKRNLKTVDAAARVLSGIFHVDAARFAVGVGRTAAITGLRGRWEVLRHGEGLADVICDTGHNAHGLKWVGEQIDRISCDYDNVWFIIGLSGDKDLDAIMSYLPRNVRYVATQAASPRAMDAVELANAMSDNGFIGTMIRPVSEAFREILAKAGSKDLVFIGGSNFVVAEII